MEALSDFLLQSGFENQFRRRRTRSRSSDDSDFDFDPDDTLEALRRAIKEALRNSGPARPGTV
jgi:hypothetical protein